jgi:hypothetical protein
VILFPLKIFKKQKYFNAVWLEIFKLQTEILIQPLKIKCQEKYEWV